MKLITLKFKIIIGVILFIILICAGYSATMFNTSSSNSQSIKVGNIEYKGQFLTPVENFNVVTSKYGARIHPISRKAEFSYRN